MLRRDVRYQAAIIHADQVLLLKVVDRDSGATFWVLPEFLQALLRRLLGAGHQLMP